MLVRPEGLAVGVSGPASAARAEVVSRRFFGHDQLLGLRLQSGRVVRSRRLGYPAWHPGDHVQVWIEGPGRGAAARAATCRRPRRGFDVAPQSETWPSATTTTSPATRGRSSAQLQSIRLGRPISSPWRIVSDRVPARS